MKSISQNQLIVHCLRCGKKIKSNIESDGVAKLHCKCCKMYMCSKPMNQRELSIRVVMPPKNYQLNNQRL